MRRRWKEVTPWTQNAHLPLHNCQSSEPLSLPFICPVLHPQLPAFSVVFLPGCASALRRGSSPETNSEWLCRADGLLACVLDCLDRGDADTKRCALGALSALCGCGLGTPASLPLLTPSHLTFPRV